MSTIAKYMHIVDWTKEQIHTGAFLPKDKFFSEAELCEKFKYSRQTVRRALEELEHLGYIDRVQGSGTYISSNKSKIETSFKQSNSKMITIGLISTYMDNYIFPSIIRSIENVFYDYGHALMMASTNNLITGEARALKHMLDREVDGLIVEPTRSALPCVNIDLYRAIIAKGIPLVFIDSFYPELSVPYVALDDVKAGYLATQHLIDKGHKDIFCVFPHNNRQGHLRYLGHVNALTDNNIVVQEDRICWYSVHSMVETLLSNQFIDHINKTTAALCYNDSVAMTVVGFLKKREKMVPEYYSIIGIDNSELSRVCELTSIAHPAEQLGTAAAKLLDSMLKGEEGKTILFEPRLIERNSVHAV